jgi:two-component system chemotaxis family response regulator WspR
MLAGEKDIEFHYCAEPANAIDMAQQVKATVILQDLVMPDIDGITLVRYFRANNKTRSIPVIVLSSKEEATTKRDAFTNGASDYLVKLPDEIELLARIRAHSQSYLTQLERNAAFHALREMQKQLEASNKELQRLSAQDGLTGIPNRRSFDEMLEKEWKRAQRNKTALALIMIDIDFFKRFNDNYGHLAGDDCLKRVAQALQTALHRPADIIARYGGEEFAAILPETTNDGAYTVAENLHNALMTLAIEHGHSEACPIVSISQGIAFSEDCQFDDVAELMTLADKALYDAKEAGRNQFKILQLDKAG